MERSLVQQAIVGCTVIKTCRLGIASDWIWNLTQDASGEAAFSQGYTESATNQTTLVVNTNTSWFLEVGRNDWTSPSGYDKAESDLLLKVTNTPTGTIQNGYSSYRSPPPQAAKEKMLEHSEGVSNNNVEVQYKVLLDWTKDIPGSYSITVTYTLSTGTLE